MDVGWMNFPPNQFGSRLFPFGKKKKKKKKPEKKQTCTRPTWQRKHRTKPLKYSTVVQYFRHNIEQNLVKF